MDMMIRLLCFFAATSISLQYKRYRFAVQKLLNRIAKAIELWCLSLSFALFSLRNRVGNTYISHSKACFPTF